MNGKQQGGCMGTTRTTLVLSTNGYGPGERITNNQQTATRGVARPQDMEKFRFRNVSCSRSNCTLSNILKTKKFVVV